MFMIAARLALVASLATGLSSMQAFAEEKASLKDVCAAIEAQIIEAHAAKDAVALYPIVDGNAVAIPNQRTADIMKFSLTYANLSCERFS